MTVWVVGTSASIDRNGWFSEISGRTAEEPVVNLSIGNQTSIMGLMRVYSVREKIQEGDIVVWEYTLLDVLLEDFYGLDLVLQARTVAWNEINDAGASILNLIIPPRHHLQQPNHAETRLNAAADEVGVRSLNVRNLFSDLKIDDPADHYRDDRHPKASSPIVKTIANAVLQAISEIRDQKSGADFRRIEPRTHWTWLSAAKLSSRKTVTIENSLTSIDVAKFAPDQPAFMLPCTGRVVAIGVASEVSSGSIWCGHRGCPPASVKLEEGATYPFLLRSTRLPCVRGKVDRLKAAPAWAYGNGVWADYGQTICQDERNVRVFGMILEDN